MGSVIGLLAWQAAARPPEGAVDGLQADLSELLEDFPRTRLVVLPEYHLTRVNGTPAARAAEFDRLAEPLDGPRALRGLLDEAVLPG
ncbi:hypothetical protein [Agilicoccus flavus]|uniref:hypothetical protein n=1 Tax=Agilicoccus flavus TaxID=2775968 RepID=UPI001CF67B8E|nr:hypothetical protein [Agilicoccus flavus]